MAEKKRHWWVAFLLMPFNGVGYLYAGRIDRFILFWSFIILIYIFLITDLFGWLAQIDTFIAFFCITFCFFVFFFVDASLFAKRSKSYTLQWFNRWWIYLITFISLGFLQFVPELIFEHPQNTYAVRLFSIPARSMSPTLLVGDHIIADSRYYLKKEPKRGEIVVFAHSNRPQVFWVKRIIGLPGDDVQMIDGILYINHKPIPRKRSGEFSFKGETLRQIPIYIENINEKKSYQTLDQFPNAPGDNTKLFKVPAGKYFALGDNRDNSNDSRFNLGFIPREIIMYNPTGIYWSRDWSRIGTTLN